MPVNTELHLQYRDASNYKKSTYGVLEGPVTDAHRARLTAALSDGEFLIVPQLNDRLGVLLNDPRAAMLDDYAFSDDDHSWVELDGLAVTSREPTVAVTVEQFVAAVEACAAEGWNDVDPYNDPPPPSGRIPRNDPSPTAVVALLPGERLAELGWAYGLAGGRDFDAGSWLFAVADGVNFAGAVRAAATQWADNDDHDPGRNWGDFMLEAPDELLAEHGLRRLSMPVTTRVAVDHDEVL